MKHSVLLILCVWLAMTSKAQYSKDHFNGKWICTYRTKADGSLVIEPVHKTFLFCSIDFISSNELLIHESNYFKNSSQKKEYAINNDTIVIDKNEYKIDYFRNDSLVLTELRLPNKYIASQPFKYYFVWEPLKMTTDFNLNQDTIIAPIYYGPYLSDTLQEIIIKKIIQHSEFHNFSFNLIIDNKEKKLSILPKGKAQSQQIIDELNRDISGLFSEISIKSFNKYKIITIPYKITSDDIIHNKKRMKTFRFAYAQTYINSVNAPDYAAESRNTDYAIDYYRRKKLKKAVAYFEKAHFNNPYNTETMMNIAAVYYELDQKDKACEWWQKLKDLGQVEGTKRFDYYCR